MEQFIPHDAEGIALQLSPQLKKLGYNKRKLTWYKDKDQVTILFNIQKSQWSNDTWYYNFGVSLHSIYPLKARSYKQNHIQTRCDCCSEHAFLTADQVVLLLDIWEERYGSVPALCSRIKNKEIPNETLGCNGYKALCYLSELAGIPNNLWTPDSWFAEIDLRTYW